MGLGKFGCLCGKAGTFINLAHLVHLVLAPPRVAGGQVLWLLI